MKNLFRLSLDHLASAFKNVKEFETEADKGCAKDVRQFARLDYIRKGQSKMVKRAKEINDSRAIAVKELRKQPIIKSTKSVNE